MFYFFGETDASEVFYSRRYVAPIPSLQKIVTLMTYELPLEVPLRLIGGTTDFNLYYSLYANNVFICVIIVLSRVKFSVNKFVLSFFLTKYNIYNYVTQYSIGIFQMILLCNKCGYKI